MVLPAGLCFNCLNLAAVCCFRQARAPSACSARCATRRAGRSRPSARSCARRTAPYNVAKLAQGAQAPVEQVGSGFLKAFRKHKNESRLHIASVLCHDRKRKRKKSSQRCAPHSIRSLRRLGIPPLHPAPTLVSDACSLVILRCVILARRPERAQFDLPQSVRWRRACGLSGCEGRGGSGG